MDRFFFIALLTVKPWFMKKITVIGSGTMGNGIAQTFAQFDYTVNMVDISEEALQRGIDTISKNIGRQIDKGYVTAADKTRILNNITLLTELKPAVEEADLIVEAASENPELKFRIFADLDRYCRPEAILASNTSSISITNIASVTKRPEQVIGMHFMNPVPVMKLVEIIRGYATADQVVQSVVDLSEKLNKVPVKVNDYPGFISNRILIPMINEAIYSLFEGVAGVKEIDTIMKLGMAHPMGPLELADFIGLDVCLAILKVLQEGFGNPKYAPCPLLINMVNAGFLGKKSGKGFYSYGHGTKELIVADRPIRF